MSYVKLIAQLDKVNAVEQAIAYSNSGADEIAYMDMSAIEEHREFDVEQLRAIARVAEVPVIAGGGIKRLEDVKKMIYAGASMVYMKHAARLDVHFVKEMVERFGKNKIGVAIDLTDIDVAEFAEQCEDMGAGGVWILGFKKGQEQRVHAIKEGLDIPVMISMDDSDEENMANTIKQTHVGAVLYTGNKVFDVMALKKQLNDRKINVNTFESALDFDTFKVRRIK